MSRLRFVSAREVFEAFPSAASDIETPPADEPSLDYLAKLAAGESPEDAVSFCAYLLGRREAVWWASQSVRAVGPPVNRDEEKALLTAEAWVREPEEHRRRSALDIGLNGDHELAGVWVSLAAGGAGGTLVMGDQQGPPAPPEMTARSARVGVLIALARLDEVRDRADRINGCVELCRRLATQQSGPG